MSIKDITIVITSFQSENKIKKCLNSINKECKVINVENSNNLEHKKNIEREFVNVKCILAGANLGYGKANNIGLKNVNSKYALILNPDAQLFSNTLEDLLKVAHQKSDFAVIGPNITDDRNFKELTNQIDFDVRLIKNVKGFAMFLNLSEFKEVGFFDENFFIYLEEIDLCMRLIKKNKKIYWCKNILVYHEGGKSHDKSANEEMELSRNWHWMWSTFYYNKKYKGFTVSFLIVLPKLISSFLKFIIYLIFLNKKKRAIYFQRLSGLLNGIVGKSSWYRPKI